MEPDGKAVRVPMRTGTHGDILAAVGMADLLGAAFTRGVRLQAVEGAFLVQIPEPLSPRVLARIGKAPGYPYMRPNERTAFPVEVPENERLDYPAVNSDQKLKWEAMKSLRKEERLQRAGKATAELHEFQVEQRPRRDWSRWRAFNLLQGDETANRIYLKIRQEDAASFPLKFRLTEGRRAGVRFKIGAIFRPPRTISREGTLLGRAHCPDPETHPKGGPPKERTARRWKVGV